MTRATIVFVVNAAAGAFFAAPAPSALPGVASRHAYYLFLIQESAGCEDCYIPLLVTAQPLEEFAQQERDEKCVVVMTHERDSIVGLERGVPVSFRDVDPRARRLRLRSRQYRYQEVGAPEVLRLLEHPEGTIPISRPLAMAVPARERLEDLIASFGGRP